MDIGLVRSAPPGPPLGDETTARRWGHLLEQLGHSSILLETTDVLDDIEMLTCDLVVAIGARACKDAIRAIRDRHPDRPLVIALDGCDLYDTSARDPELQPYLDRADAFVVFHDRAPEQLSDERRSRTYVIYQGVEETPGALEPAPLRASCRSRSQQFEVCVASHLHAHRDPLRTAAATRRVEASSRLFVTHIGRALDAHLEARARRASETHQRYDWIGGVPRREALRYIVRADLLVETSTIAGGRNVLSEAIVLDTPVVASRIPGNTGVLGPDYTGLVPAGRETALADILQSVELDAHRRNRLIDQCKRIQPRFALDREREAWRTVLEACV